MCGGSAACALGSRPDRPHHRVLHCGPLSGAYPDLPFRPGEDADLFLSSADFMTRNTERRVEVACPILDPELRRRVFHITDVLISDNVKARQLGPDGLWHPRRNGAALLQPGGVPAGGGGGGRADPTAHRTLRPEGEPLAPPDGAAGPPLTTDILFQKETPPRNAAGSPISKRSVPWTGAGVPRRTTGRRPSGPEGAAPGGRSRGGTAGRRSPGCTGPVGGGPAGTGAPTGRRQHCRQGGTGAPPEGEDQNDGEEPDCQQVPSRGVQRTAR